MKNKKKILIIDDEIGARESLRIILDSDYDVTVAKDASEALEKNLAPNADLILLDIMMPKLTGIEYLKIIKDEQHLSVPVIMVTATQTLKTAIDTIKTGALDYITKPFDIDEIKAVIEEHISSPILTKTSNKTTSFDIKNIIGYNTTLEPIFKLIERLATNNSTVLIHGESGTGKEIIARAIHQLSAVKNGPFIPIQLSAISENLIESELFGHVKGSFTGADRDRMGAFEQAQNGTLFLDEIGEIDESIQIKLLRVLQEKEYRRVGDNKLQKTNARIITATHKNLEKLVESSKFRTDLFYRLNVVPITLPALRERKEDLAALCSYFLEKISTKLATNKPSLSPQCLQIFLDYDWPGNIRQLENCLENMVLLSDSDTLTPEFIPTSIKPGNSNSSSTINKDADNVLDSMERETIRMALMQNNGVLTTTAKYLGTTRRILKYKMDKLGINKGDWLRN